VGKVIHESLTTDRVDDICSNVLSIIRKLGQATRLPGKLRILACSAVEADDLSPSAQLPSSEPVPVAPAHRVAGG
jgi:hypothetical protein